VPGRIGYICIAGEGARSTGLRTEERAEVISVHVELTRTYPVARNKGFDYFMDVRSWTDWTTLDVADSEAVKWELSGDEIRYSRKSSLPGLSMQGKAVLDEVTPQEMVRMTMTTRGLPEMPVECRFAHAGPGAFTLTLTVHTADSPGFVGDALQRLMFIEKMTARDMRKCLDGLEKTLGQGATG
jgi:hypothetical protein